MVKVTHQPAFLRPSEWKLLIAIADNLIPCLDADQTKRVLNSYAQRVLHRAPEHHLRAFLACTPSTNQAFIAHLSYVLQHSLPERARRETRILLKSLVYVPCDRTRSENSY
jgi:hypothetical protein